MNKRASLLCREHHWSSLQHLYEPPIIWTEVWRSLLSFSLEAFLFCWWVPRWLGSKGTWRFTAALNASSGVCRQMCAGGFSLRSEEVWARAHCCSPPLTVWGVWSEVQLLPFGADASISWASAQAHSAHRTHSVVCLLPSFTLGSSSQPLFVPFSVLCPVSPTSAFLASFSLFLYPTA